MTPIGGTVEKDRFNRHDPLNNDALHQHAEHYLLDEFASTWEVDSAKLAQYLAENNFVFANLTDDDEIEIVIEGFARELHRLVRQAITDYQTQEQLVALGRRMDERNGVLVA